MKITPEFPDYRYQDPMRQAELVSYKQIAASKARGVALYECTRRPAPPKSTSSSSWKELPTSTSRSRAVAGE